MAIHEEVYLHEYLDHHYGLILKKAEPVEGVLKLHTNQGLYALKKVREGDERRWRWICRYAKEAKVDFLPVPKLTSRQIPYFAGFHDSYVLLPWIDAKHVSLTQPSEWIEISHLLARFHQSTVPFVPEKQSLTCKEEWEQIRKELECYKRAAQWTVGPSHFDRMWIGEASYLLGVVENLLQYYDKIEGDAICQQSSQYGRVCHNRLHQSNILRDPDGKIHLIDWNEFRVGLRSQELSDWIFYAYERTGSDEIVRAILKAYQDVSPFEENEYALLYARFLFPEKYVALLRGFYQQQQHPLIASTPEAFSHLRAEGKRKLKFVGKFASNLKDWFGVSIPTIPWLTGSFHDA